MDKAFLAAYSLRLIATCHRRGAFAMGGMSAFIPVKGDEAANAGGAGQGPRRQAARGRQRPRRHLGRASRRWCRWRWRRSRRCPAPTSSTEDPDRIPGRDEMLELHDGPRTEAGARENIRVGVQYLAAWLGGQRRGAALQSDGRRRDRRDLPRAAVAMAAVRSAARRRPPLHPRPVRRLARRRTGRARRRPQPRGSRRACSTSWSPPTSSRNS